MAQTTFPGGIGPDNAGHPWLGQQWNKVLYVNSSVTTSGDGNSGEDPNAPLATIGGSAGALYKAASTRTLIRVGAGHTETIASADAWSTLGTKTSVKLLGDGDETDRPTLSWTTATSTLLMDTAGMWFDNFVMNWDSGTLGTGGSPIAVAAPITCSAAGCGLRRIKVRAGTDANNTVTIGFTTTAAADDLVMDDVFIYSATAAEATTFIQFVGADRLWMRDCVIKGATSAVGVGVVRFLTTASTDITIEGCDFINRKASSTAAVTGMAGVSGSADMCRFGVLSDAAGALTGAWGTAANMQFYDCRITNLAGEAGATFGTVSA